MVEHNQSSYYNNGYKFNGKELDEATGMYYYGARYYDPRISIFISVDPLAEQTMDPYGYVYNNPINLIDPTGMGPELPPSGSGATGKIIRYNINIFSALFYSNNTSNKQLYEWVKGNKTDGRNKLLGAVGEAMAMDDIEGSIGFFAKLNVLDKSQFGKSYRGYQVDIQRKVKTGLYKIGNGYIGSMNVKFAADFNNFDGSSYTKSYGDGVTKKTFTFNYEVKTLNASGSVGNLYENLAKGIEQTNARGKGVNVIGVLMTDQSAWEKVSQDSYYGPKLETLYNQMKQEGNQLQLNNGLYNRSNRALHGLKDAIND